MSPQSRLLRRSRRAPSTAAGLTASRGACRLHPRWRAEASRPVCGWKTRPLWPSVRSCEPRNTPSLPLTDTRATAHVRAAHACALLWRLRLLVSLATPYERVWAEAEWTGSWSWSWGVYPIQCKASITKSVLYKHIQTTGVIHDYNQFQLD